MNLDPEEVSRGTELLIKHLEDIQAENPDLGDFHSAFEHYCMVKYSLGSSATSQRTAGKHDLGIDFYSTRDRSYHIAQCKIPEKDWLEAHPTKARTFTQSAIDDPRDALAYLLGDSKVSANDRVRHLYSLIATDKREEDFSVVFFLIIFGRLNDRGTAAFSDLRTQYEGHKVRLILQQIDDLVDEFIVGAARETDQIQVDLRVDASRVLRSRDYCYFLANGADLFHAFQKYGWRLFDLNLRYEIRNSAVNGDIIESLSRHKTRKSFHHFNNGLIIIAANYTLRDKDSKIRLTGPQIVNGLQTVKSIYNAVSSKEVSLEDLERDCVVQIKVIQTNDPIFISSIVQATNNQNPMSARNLKANNREQKQLRTGFGLLSSRWFYQVKEGEWESLTQEGGRFFKQVVGYPPSDFKPDATRKKGRVIDNEEAAKSWLAFIGFADLAGDRVTHYFSDNTVYSTAFTMKPTTEHWKKLGQSIEFDVGRSETLEQSQGSAEQYLLAYTAWQFVKYFVPSAQKYREQGLQEGVISGKIKKSSGSITSPQTEQEAYLSTNKTYQTWRLMANMKELLVECVAAILVQKYGPLTSATCTHVLNSFDAKDFLNTGDIRELAQRVSTEESELGDEMVFSRISGFLHYVSGQFWEEKEKQLLSTSRLRTVLLRREMAADFKRQLWALNERKGLDKTWKPEGVTFLQSLP